MNTDGKFNLCRGILCYLISLVIRIAVLKYLLSVCRGMTENTMVRTEETNLPSEVRFPTKSYSRREFYKSLENIRYTLKVNLVNGQQAEDVPIDIENLIDFLGDVEFLVKSTDGLHIEFRNHNHWTAKLNTGCDYMMNQFDWESLESQIEELAEEHSIALEKSVSMSGRGYQRESMRHVGVTYSFGKYSEENRMIGNEDNPLSKVEWVGGNIGDKSDLNPSTIHIKNVKTYKSNLMYQLRQFLSSLF